MGEVSTTNGSVLVKDAAPKDASQDPPPRGAASKLFTPLAIANGFITLKHRIVMSPMTRNRGVPLLPESTKEKPNRVWLPDALIAKYYAQRATDGGLIITESILPNAESGAMPGVPGMWLPEHKAGWKLVTEAVHARKGVIYAQLTHQGRVAIPHFTGHTPVSSSATPWSTDEKYPSPPPFLPPGTPYKESLVAYKDFPPVALTIEGIKQTIADYVAAAQMAIEAGFDGVEIHGGNGYLVDQFLNDNVNRRTDDYGGTPAKRGRFALDLIESVGKAIGVQNTSLRLCPFGVYNDMAESQRWETYTHLLEQIKERFPEISYVHFVEAREDEIPKIQDSWGKERKVDLSFARKILSPIPILSAGKWDKDTCWGAVEKGDTIDACVFARWFVSNPDLVERLREGRDLTMYNRAKFYGPTSKREVGFTDYLTWEELEEDKKKEAEKEREAEIGKKVEEEKEEEEGPRKKKVRVA